MAKKKKITIRNRSGLSSLTNLTVEELKKRGEQYLHQEKFQDAVKCFKEILKQGDNAEAVLLLAKAYRGRIESLAAKSMVKEAMTLLDAMQQRCGRDGVDTLRFLLELKAGNYSQAAKLFTACDSLLDKKQRQKIESLFGGLLLFANNLQVEDFPKQSLLVQHFPIAQSVFHHYCKNELEQTQQALQNIPFRSPYRDFRMLMTGLLSWLREKEKAAEILRKIDTDSPYYQYAARFLSELESPAEVVNAVAISSRNDQQKIRDRYNLNIQQYRALDDLTQAKGQAVKLYQVIKKHTSCFSVDEKNKLVRQVLPFCGEYVLEILPRLRDIKDIEKIHFSALAAENDEEFSYALDFWDDYLLDREKMHSINHKESALILRHQVRLMRRSFYESSPEEILDKLLKSLEYDPTHALTWLNAIKQADECMNLNKKYQIINDAVEKMPENIEILITAMNAAGQRGAHKKAAKFAMRVLSMDSINTSAMDFLAESHMEHARRLASQKKWLLAEKELSETDARVKAVRLRGRRQICLGMIHLLQDKNEEGLQCIAAGRTENKTVLLGYVLIALEARLFGVHSSYRKEFDKELKLAAEGQFDKTEFLRLISWILGFSGKQWLLLKECCHLLKKYFSRCAGATWSREEGISLCKALDRTGLFVALANTSNRLLKQFPGDAEIKAYQLIGTIENKKNPIHRLYLEDYYEVIKTLIEKGNTHLLNRLEYVFRNQSYHEPQSFDIYLPEDDQDNEIFKIPDHVLEREEKKRKSHEAKQLNLFDDLP